MRVLYIHHEYYNRRAKYADVMQELGHHVDTIQVRRKKKPNQIQPRHLKDDYDIVWLLSGHYLAYNVITDSALEVIRESGAKLVAYTTIPTDTPLREWLDYYRIFDWLFFQCEESVTFLQENDINAVYVPLGFHPDQYPVTRRKPKYDVTFMGSPQTNVPVSEDLRARLLNRLRKFNVVVFGKGFKGRLHPDIPVYSYKTHRQQVQVYSQSKINLDIPHINSALPEYRGKYHAKNRLFEVPATGNFLLTADCPEFRSLVGDDACGFYEPDNIEQVVSFYLANEQLRKEIASRGHEVVQIHTFEKRFRRMFDIISSTM